MAKLTDNTIEQSPTRPHDEGGVGPEMIDDILLRAFGQLFEDPDAGMTKTRGESGRAETPEPKDRVHSLLKRFFFVHQVLRQALEKHEGTLNGQAIWSQALKSVKASHRKSTFKSSLYDAVVDYLNEPSGGNIEEIEKLLDASTEYRVVRT